MDLMSQIDMREKTKKKSIPNVKHKSKAANSKVLSKRSNENDGQKRKEAIGLYLMTGKYRKDFD